MHLVSDLNLNNNKIQNFCVESLPGTPEILRKGKIWVDEESGSLKIASSSEETRCKGDNDQRESPGRVPRASERADRGQFGGSVQDGRRHPCRSRHSP